MGTRSIRRLCRLLVVVALGLAVFAPVAALADDSGYPTTTTSTTTVSCNSPATQQVCATAVTNPPVRTPSTGLAFTGGNIALLVGLGLVAAAGGVVLVRLSRHATASR
jgi:hypothetical protein